MSNTIVYANEALLENRLVHVMAYQNNATTRGPNAMLLPIPSSVAMGASNAIDMTPCKGVLRAYEKVLRRASERRSRSYGFGFDDDGLSRGVEVFDVGSYTVVLADQPQDIPDALERVPAERRPAPSPAIFEWYERNYPEWTVALCCYNGDIEAEPIAFWYEPMYQDRLFFPAVDAHDGGAPQFGQAVTRDHTLVYGVATPKDLTKVHKLAHSDPAYAERAQPPYDALFPVTFNGTRIERPGSNGDFVMHVSNPGVIRVVHPTKVGGRLPA